jgi:hypothetical protein
MGLNNWKARKEMALLVAKVLIMKEEDTSSYVRENGMLDELYDIQMELEVELEIYG